MLLVQNNWKMHLLHALRCIGVGWRVHVQLLYGQLHALCAQACAMRPGQVDKLLRPISCLGQQHMFAVTAFRITFPTVSRWGCSCFTARTTSSALNLLGRCMVGIIGYCTETCSSLAAVNVISLACNYSSGGGCSLLVLPYSKLIPLARVRCCLCSRTMQTLAACKLAVCRYLSSH